MDPFESYTTEQWDEILELTEEFEVWSPSQRLAACQNLDEAEVKNQTEGLFKRKMSNDESGNDEGPPMQRGTPPLFSDNDSDSNPSQVSNMFTVLNDTQSNVPNVLIISSNYQSLLSTMVEDDYQVIDIFVLFNPTGLWFLKKTPKTHPFFFVFKICQEGDGNKKLVKLISVEQRFLTKFNIRSELMRLEIINLDEPNPPDWLERLFTQILETVRENFYIQPNERVRIQLNHPDLDNPIYIAFRPYEEVTLKLILEEIAIVMQSKKTLVIDGQTTITVTYVPSKD
ncbi:hypothetical protein SNE40_018282 [Patella caerulea]|uniref:Uncharacterized protein n=1 Tax=Patella caerulea TaxID=87958 RepID=A0AAN8JBH8_PATCE